MTTRERKEMTAWEIDQWSSHRLILEPLFKMVYIRNTLELGAGMFSTKMLAANCDNLVSIETDRDWFLEMESKLPSPKNALIYSEDTNVSKYVKNTSEIYHSTPMFDLLFVDGTDRQQSVIEGMKQMIPYIVIHDFLEETKGEIGLLPSYEEFDTIGKHFNPTAIYSTNKVVIGALTQLYQPTQAT